MNRVQAGQLARLEDGFSQAQRMVRELKDGPGLYGWGLAVVRRELEIIEMVPFANKITDVGDEYYTRMGIAGVGPANPAAPTLATGMQLGTGTTAEAKNGAGAAIVTYITLSAKAFDATFPSAASKGAGLGWRATYRTTWGAGIATSNGISEVVLINQAVATNSGAAAANTISRALLSPTVNKGVLDSLEVTWNHDFLGA